MAGGSLLPIGTSASQPEAIEATYWTIGHANQQIPGRGTKTGHVAHEDAEE